MGTSLNSGPMWRRCAQALGLIHNDNSTWTLLHRRVSSPATGALHHVELWVPDIDRATAQWGWLLTELGYQPFKDWPGGRSWFLASTYIVIEQSPDMITGEHDRKRPGLNHLAFHAGNRPRVDALAQAATEHGWALLFADKHPYAGGPHTYAAYLANTDGYEVELIATAS